jgi:hypothetical protein
MKNILTLFLIMVSCSIAVAWDTGQSVHVKLLSSSATTNTDPKPDESTDVRHRMPSRPILCSISVENGVSFDDGSNPDIISYEIKDADNNPVTVTGDEADFILTLFSLTGEYVIQFRTDEYIYYGSIGI